VIVPQFPPLFEDFREAFQFAVARQLRRFHSSRIPSPLRRPREHSHFDFEHRREHFRLLHAGEVGKQLLVEERRQPAEFSVHTEESARRPAAKIRTEGEKKQNAICCNCTYCVAFRSGDIYVSSNCNANRNSFIHIGTRWSDRVYANDTAFCDFFTGAVNFTVKEIEMFEIAD
jgi:hypothetical protein